jgi:threonine synthase
MKSTSLICTRCQKLFPLDRIYPRCDVCNEPLEVELITRGKIKKSNILKQTILERYADFFPFLNMNKTISLHEGFTPLIESFNLASELKINRIFLKNESQNPTWSFKDRGTLIGIQHALGSGCKKIGTVSTGNMAVSMAAYGAKAKVPTFILISADIPPEKINPIAIYQPVLIRVEGDYGKLYYRSLELGRQYNICFINSDVPFRVEGSKTIAFEICEQMDFSVPDFVVVPTSSGGNFRGILKGFKEFKLCGLIDKEPKMIAAQALGCSPIYNAYMKKDNKISRVDAPDTIAHAIANAYPPSGNEVLRKIKENNGIVTAATDEEILQAQKQLAREGIFGQPAAAVPLAAVSKLRKEEVIHEDDTVVCIVTGSGLKYPAILKQHLLKVHYCKLEGLSYLFEHDL